MIPCICTSDEPVINFKMNNAKSERVIEINTWKSFKHEEKYDIDCRRTPRFAIGDVVVWICLLLRRRLRLLYRKIKKQKGVLLYIQFIYHFMRENYVEVWLKFLKTPRFFPDQWDLLSYCIGLVTYQMHGDYWMIAKMYSHLYVIVLYTLVVPGLKHRAALKCVEMKCCCHLFIFTMCSYSIWDNYNV